MNILIFGRSIKEDKKIDFKLFFKLLSNYKNIKNVKQINIFLCDNVVNKTKIINKTFNKIKIRIRDIGGPFENIENILKMNKVPHVDVIINDHSTMKFMHQLVAIKFFEKSTIITNNTILFLQDMPSIDNKITPFENNELFTMLSKLDNCNNTISIKFRTIHNKLLNLNVCPNWTIREIKTLVYYSSLDNEFINRILTQEQIASIKIHFAGKQLQDDSIISNSHIQNGSVLQQFVTIPADAGLWKDIQQQLCNRNFKSIKVTDEDFILNHPQVRRHRIYYVSRFKQIASFPKQVQTYPRHR